MTSSARMTPMSPCNASAACRKMRGSSGARQRRGDLAATIPTCPCPSGRPARGSHAGAGRRERSARRGARRAPGSRPIRFEVPCARATGQACALAILSSSTSCCRSGARRSSRSALAASLRARAGSSWTSRKTASTPAATPARASGSMYSARPPVTPSPAPGNCRLCVTSKTTGCPLPHHRQRPHVDDQVVVAEAGAALGEQNAAGLPGLELADHVAHVAGRHELALLDVHWFAGRRGRQQQVRLSAQEGGNLQHVDDGGRRRGLRRLVNVGQHRQARGAP